MTKTFCDYCGKELPDKNYHADGTFGLVLYKEEDEIICEKELCAMCATKIFAKLRMPLKKNPVVLELRNGNELSVTDPWFNGAKYVRIDTDEKIDKNQYGAISYHSEYPKY